jgi:hypothetical protein
MRKKDKMKPTKVQKPEPKVVQESKIQESQECRITDFLEANRLQKEGWLVTEVLSEIGGIRSKTWVLKKEE